ncbi:SMI1/KNR4 family protein [Paenibacillus sp. FSL L8-0340]|uniref:SMI1/KNR4 family protein n=1 Tax=Paenibacillus sp. FSL L8-0340 TaxID=2954685 RepID=UPI0031596F92
MSYANFGYLQFLTFSCTFNLYPAVDENEINRIEIEIGFKFPKVFRDLLKLTNGFETKEGVIIFGTDVIFERNQT